MYRSSLRRKKSSDPHEPASNDRPDNRLFLIKGRRHIHVTLVECVPSSLNEDDAFVLDAHSTIFVWFGLNANRIERGKAAKFVTRYKNQEKKGIPSVVYIDSDSDRTQVDFWSSLHANGPVSCETQGLNDLIFEKELVKKFQLFEIVKGKDNNHETHVMEHPNSLRYHMLQRRSHRVYILDCVSEVFIWIGKNADKTMRKFAEELVDRWKADRPSWNMYTVVYEDEEPILFREKFADWPEVILQGSEPSDRHRRRYHKQFDVRSMLESSDVTYPTKRVDASWHDNRMPITVDTADDGKGVIQIWIVDNYKLRELEDTSIYGQFYASESYIISYVWEHQKKKRCMLYFWLGRTCDGVGNSNIQIGLNDIHFYIELSSSILDQVWRLCLALSGDV